MRTRTLALAALLVSGASCNGTPTGTISVTTGEEADALTRVPAPTTLVVESVGTDGAAKELARTALPAGDISLGDVAKTDVGLLRVRGIAASGAALVRGETLFIEFGALQDASISVFVQRTGELARVPQSPGTSLDGPVAGAVLGRYLLAAAGTSTIFYDLLFMQAITPPVLPRAARSLTSYGSLVVAVDEQGATTLDLSDGTTSELVAPTGGTYAEVAGGAAVNAPDGSSYIVGATRAQGGATARVLRVGSDGKVAFATLQSARQGACATWVEGRGLVVIGGGDASAAGAEVLAATAIQGAPLPYPPDATVGCGAATLDAGHVVVAGGSASAWVLDLACSSNCKLAPWPGALPLVRAEVVTLASDAALVAGDDAAGATHVYRASAAGVREIALKVARKGARLVALPNGASAVVGGAPQIESYRD